MLCSSCLFERDVLVLTREAYCYQPILGAVLCFVLFLVYAFPLEPLVMSNGSEEDPRRRPRQRKSDLEIKGEKEYGARPPESSEPEEQLKPPATFPAAVCKPPDPKSVDHPDHYLCELKGFQPGAFTHPQLDVFAHSVAETLKKGNSSKQSNFLRRIQIVGQTDGLENPGICCWRDLVKFENECSSEAPQATPDLKLDENLLGEARACVTRKALERSFRDSLLLFPEDWPTIAVDILPGGPIGPEHRKSTVRIWIKDGAK